MFLLIPMCFAKLEKRWNQAKLFSLSLCFYIDKCLLPVPVTCACVTGKGAWPVEMFGVEGVAQLPMDNKHKNTKPGTQRINNGGPLLQK